MLERILGMGVPKMPDFKPILSPGVKLRGVSLEFAQILSVVDQQNKWVAEMAVRSYVMSRLHGRILILITAFLATIAGPQLLVFVKGLPLVKDLVGETSSIADGTSNSHAAKARQNFHESGQASR